MITQLPSSHKNPSANNLYSHHLFSWDQYLKFELALLMTHSNAAQPMVTALMLPKFLQHDYLIMKCLAYDLDDGSFNDFHKACSRILPIGWPRGEGEHLLRYHILLSEFLDDPMRSQEFHIDGNKFATLAIAFAKYFFGYILSAGCVQLY